MCASCSSAFNILLNCFVVVSGGGTQAKKNFNLGSISTGWMANEASIAGLKLKASRDFWTWDDLEHPPKHNSRTWVWFPVECLPIKRLTYKNSKDTTR
jgi:hypothetical protein